MFILNSVLPFPIVAESGQIPQEESFSSDACRPVHTNYELPSLSAQVEESF